MASRSIRSRLVIANSVVVAALLVTGGVALSQVTQHLLLASIDNDLRNRAHPFGHPPPRPPDAPGGLPPPDRPFEGDNRRDHHPGPPGPEDGPVPLDADGKPVHGTRQPIDPAAVSSPDREVWSTVTRDGERFRVYTVKAPDPVDGRAAIQDWHSLQDYDLLVSAQWALLLMFVPISIGVAGLVGYGLAKRALAPVDDMGHTAAAISGADLSRRLDIDGDDELARLAKTFNEMLDRVEAAFEHQGRFVADASHELRTPLARLRLATSAALAQGDPSEFEHAVTVANQAGESMSKLVDRLLVLARLESGDAPPKDVDLVAVAGEAAGEFDGLPGPRIQLKSSRPVHVAAHPEDVKRAVTNLIDNARRYSPADKAVTVTVGHENGFGFVLVRDEGQGIPAESLRHLGERFFRVDAARSRKEGGFGLGLSIVAATANRFGGRFKVDSVEGQGTEARLDFPLFEENSSSK